MRRILWSQLCRYRKAADGFSLMNISKLKNFPAFGRWATARRFPTARLEDSILRRLSTRFAKADALQATSLRISLEARRSHFASRRSAGSPRSDGAPGGRA